ncbi:MAG: type II toxin-antitoxin system MqsA family antitoxin [Eubacteriales bacterium]|nr:type II toxin-antitoxin system MqsA family antitoxin [Eubacteriales bacterium]
MTCFICKGDLVTTTTTYMSEYNGCYIIIKNVPCTKCTQCGEEYINGITLDKIENILSKLKDLLTEFAVVDYNNAA